MHGIGGTSAQSMLGAPAGAPLVPLWPARSNASADLWSGDDPDVAAFHWAPLTSGSKWFVLWPLLLPFTLLNVAGFMHHDGAIGRVTGRVHEALCVVVTCWYGGWLVLAGQLLAEAQEWNADLAFLGSVGVAVATILATRVGVAASEGGGEGRGPGAGHGRAARRLSDPDFFEVGWGRWWVHVAALALTFGACSVAWSAGRGRGAAWRLQSEEIVVAGGCLVVALLAVEAVLALTAQVTAGRHGRREWVWVGAGVAASGLGAALVGGLLVALLRVVVADNSSLRGPAFILFDVYGLALLAGVATAVVVAVRLLTKRSPGERRRDLLPNPMSWVRARLALGSRAAIAGLSATTIAFLTIGIPVYLDRAPEAVAEWLRRIGIDRTTTAADRLREQLWYPSDTPPVHIAQVTIYGLFGFMVLNLVSSRVSRDALRRVGSVWDVLTFWPRRFHPFAVRPYTAAALPELTALLKPSVEPGANAAVAAPAGWFDGRLAVVAHSQGSVLATTALAHLGRNKDRSGVHLLVTAGCPLRSLYLAAFPAYGHGLVDAATDGLAEDGRWTNVFRFTDHVGRAVFCTDDEWAPLSADGPSGVREDRAIADPRRRQGVIDGHNNYWTDDRVEDVVHGA